MLLNLNNCELKNNNVVQSFKSSFICSSLMMDLFIPFIFSKKTFTLFKSGKLQARFFGGRLNESGPPNSKDILYLEHIKVYLVF